MLAPRRKIAPTRKPRTQIVTPNQIATPKKGGRGGVYKATEELRGARRARTRDTLKAASAGAAVYSGILYLGTKFGTPHSYISTPELLSIFGMTAAPPTAATYAGSSVIRVEKATEKVGRALSHASRSGKNPELKKLLNQYKYVLIDRKGRLVFTDTRSPVLGRYRLECKSLREGKRPLIVRGRLP